MLPLGRPVVLELTSRDVIHSFTLNEMRVRQDAVPGIETHMVYADRARKMGYCLLPAVRCGPLSHAW
jgi:cytochrome c oxidase subunit II